MSNYAKTQNWIAYLTSPNADFSAFDDAQLDDLANSLASIPRFKTPDPGNDRTVCLAAWCQEDKYEEGSDAVALYLYDKEQQCGDWWTGSLSDKVVKGNDATAAASTWCQITLANLAAIGYQYNNDLSKLHTLVGKTIPCCVDEVTTKRGKSLCVIKYIGQGRARARRVKIGVVGAAKAPAFGAQAAFGAPAPAPIPPAAPVPPPAPASVAPPAAPASVAPLSQASAADPNPFA